MKVSVVGVGYVGLVAAACLADGGNHVVCVDNDEKKINDLRKGKIPIFEPGQERNEVADYLDPLRPRRLRTNAQPLPQQSSFQVFDYS